MVDDWMDILLRGEHETSVPNLTITGGEIGTLTGSGQVTWNADAGVRIQAVSDGVDTLTDLVLFGHSTPGQLIPPSSDLTFSGLTQQGWMLTADRVHRHGYRSLAGLPNIVWDLNTSGIKLRREAPFELGRSLSMLMGPAPLSWVRMTEIEICNEFFGHRSSSQDWMTTTCGIGRVSARRRSDDWFEVRVCPPAGEQMLEASKACEAVIRAFSFILGRRCAIRGYEEIDRTQETRRLIARQSRNTRGFLLRPLGDQLVFKENVERLVGLAIDFFLTELGERVATFWHLCWDTLDNTHRTQLMVSSVCVEGLLRLATETGRIPGPEIDSHGLSEFRTWLEASLKASPPDTSQQLLQRIKGMLGNLNHTSANHIFRDWINRGVLETTNEDLRSWSDARNSSAHGRLAATDDWEKLQTRFLHHTRIQNVLNKITLQLMGYTGSYIDYAQPGYPPAKFPTLSSPAEVTATGAKSSSRSVSPAAIQAEESNVLRPQALTCTFSDSVRITPRVATAGRPRLEFRRRTARPA